MSLVNYTSRVPAKSQTVKTLEAMSKGEMQTSQNLMVPDGYAEYILNCKYIADALQVGRGGLVKSHSTTVTDPGAIRHMISGVIDEEDRCFISAENGVFEVVPDGTYSLVSATTTAQKLIMFNGDLIICAGEYVQRYDGTTLYRIGTQANTVINASAIYSSKCYSGVTASLAWSTGHSDAKRLLSCSIYMKKVGTPTGTCKLTIDGIDSSSVDVTIGVLTDYALVEFLFSDPVILSGASTPDFVMSVTGGDASNYLDIGLDVDSKAMLTVNGTITPKGYFGVSFNSRLYLGGDGHKIYYSNYLLADDFYSTSSDGLTTYGGYVSFADNAGSEATGAITLFGDLFITGSLSGEYITTRLDKDNIETGRYNGGATSWRGFIPTPKGIFILSSGELFIAEGSAAYGDITMQSVSDPVKAFFSNRQSDELSLYYNPLDHQLWVASSNYEEFKVLHLKGGQWVSYAFKDIGLAALTYSGGALKIGSSLGEVFNFALSETLDDGTTYDTEVKTKSYVFSPFTRTILREVLWVVEGDYVDCKLQVLSDSKSIDIDITSYQTAEYAGDANYFAGDANNYAIQNKTTPPARLRGKSNVYQFRVYNFTAQSAGTAIGSIILKISDNGRAL